MPVNFVLIILSAFVIGLALIYFLKIASLKFKLLMPSGTPLIGGIAVAGAFIFSCLFGMALCGVSTKGLVGIIVSSLLMLIFGILDDWKELSVATKFLVQIIAATILVSFGVRTQIVHIGSALNIVITLIWVLAITNAFNHLDVMDGVAGGGAIIISLALFIISSFNADINSQILSLALVGGLLSFIIFNLPPAKIYLGNSGSHFLGFVLAATALVVSYASLDRKIALLCPLLIFGLPIFDTAYLIFMRIKKRKLPFKKSNDHIVLRLLALGYPKNKSLIVMLSWGAFFALCAILITWVSNVFGIMVAASAVLTSLILAKKISRVQING